VDAAELTTRIVQSKAQPPKGEQLELLLELTARYGEMGILDGQVLPALHTVCPAAQECWSRIPSSKRPSGIGQFDARSEKGCMFLPWAGPRYRRGGVCVLGMNLRYAGEDWEFAMEHRIALDPSGGQEQSLRVGRRAHRSYWSRGTMRDAAAVLRSWRGEAHLETQEPSELVDALLSTARVQAVKCSPIEGRSSPEPAMSRNCPPRYLRMEVDVLRPAVMLSYGGPAHGALRELGELAVEEDVRGFRRGTMRHAGGAFTVFLLTHPAHGGWHAAHHALVVSLVARPAAH